MGIGPIWGLPLLHLDPLLVWGSLFQYYFLQRSRIESYPVFIVWRGIFARFGSFVICPTCAIWTY